MKAIEKVFSEHRIQAAAAACAAVLLISSVAAGAAAEYDFILVEAFNPEYDLREVYMTDINESGIGCGTSTSGSFYDGFSWTESGDKEIIPITWPHGINNQNRVVGGNRIYDVETGQSIFVPPAGQWPLTRLRGINDSGVAVGYAECQCSNSDHVVQDALLWDEVNGSRTTGVLAARELLRINNHNVAVGNIRPSAGSSEGFVYDVDTGDHVNLSDLLPAPLFFRPWSEAHDINEGGTVTGVGWDGEFVRGMTWSEEAGFTFFTGLDGGSPGDVHARGINADGTVVGYALNGSTDWRAFIWDAERGMVDLNDLVEAPPDFILDWAVKINDLGWIVGIGHYGPGWGTSRGYVLRPARAGAPDPRGIASRLDLQVSPNPSPGAVTMRLGLAASDRVRMRIFDASGREIARVLDADLPAGVHSVSWTAASDLASGLYYARLEGSSTGNAVRRLILLR